MTPIGPLFWYELQRLPRRRLHLWRVLYAGALLLGLVVVYLRTFPGLPPLEALANPGELDRAGNAAFAETFLMAFLAVQQIAVIVLTPLYAAGSIADEKERRTFDFLLSSPLPHYQILLGKLLARLVYVGSIIAVGWPVLMLTFLFGGVDPEHLLAGFVIAAITAVFLGCLGVLLACQKNSLRETLPGIATSLLMPALLGLCGVITPMLVVASPITLLGFLFQLWLTGDSANDGTWFMVGFFAAAYLPLSLLLFAVAENALGDQSLPEAIPEPSARAVTVTIVPGLDVRIPTIRRTYNVSPLGDDEDPLVWKEKSFHLPWFSPERGCFVMGLLSIAAAGGFVALMILFAIMANDLANGRAIGRAAAGLVLVVFLPIVAIYPAFLGARVAASLGRERAGQTLLTLFTLPVNRGDILKAIARAILHRDRPLFWFSVGVLALGVVTGGVDWRGALAAFALVVGCGAWAIAFGIWLSVQVEMPTRASLIFLAVWGGMLLLPWFAAPLVGPDWRSAVELSCPPNGMLKMLMVADRGEIWERRPVRVALATGGVLMGLAAAFAWHAARTFEREGK